MTTTDWVMVPREPDAAQLAMGESILESVNSGHPVNGDVFCRSMYLAMISASPSPVSLEEIVGVLKVVDNDVRHHLRSDEIAPALLRPHAVQVVRSLLSRLKGMDNPEGQ